MLSYKLKIRKISLVICIIGLLPILIWGLMYLNRDNNFVVDFLKIPMGIIMISFPFTNILNIFFNIFCKDNKKLKIIRAIIQILSFVSFLLINKIADILYPNSDLIDGFSRMGMFIFSIYTITMINNIFMTIASSEKVENIECK